MGEHILKLLFAISMGGLIGAERQLRDKAAGVRTMSLICAGSTLFTIFSVEMGGSADPVRIAANIVVGVGFLGGGVILRHGAQIVGLTTASAVWFSAALGMGIGGGYYALAALSTVAAVAVLWMLPALEVWMGAVRESVVYEISLAADPERLEDLGAVVSETGLTVTHRKLAKQAGRLVATWRILGPGSRHTELVRRLTTDDRIQEFRTI